MPDSVLPNTGMTSILVGGSENTWGDKVDANFLIIDNLFSNASGTGHDHVTKGAPIPSGGLKSLTNTSAGIVRAAGDGTFALATAGSGITITTGVIAAAIHALTAKTTLVDADEFYVADSAAAFAIKKVTRDKLLTGAVLAGTPYAANIIGATSGSVALDASLYGVFTLTPNATTTLSITNAVAGKAYLVVLIITNGGSFTVNLPSGCKFPGGTVPTLSAAGTDILFFLSTDGGTTWRCTAEIDSR